MKNTFAMFLHKKSTSKALLNDLDKKANSKGKQTNKNSNFTKLRQENLSHDTLFKWSITSLYKFKELSEFILNAGESLSDYKYEDILSKNKDKKFNEKDNFSKSQSKRIRSELHKMLDLSDVIFEVLDIRDPISTRCKFIEQYVRRYMRHKPLISLLNKCDLVPAWITKGWLNT